jgi:hypothetical protein
MKDRTSKEGLRGSADEPKAADRAIRGRPLPSRREDLQERAPVGLLTAAECFAAARDLLRRGKVAEAFDCEAAAKILEQKQRERGGEEGGGQ